MKKKNVYFFSVLSIRSAKCGNGAREIIRQPRARHAAAVHLNCALFVEEHGKSRVEKDVAPNTSAALAVRLVCHPGYAECSVIRHLQIVQRHRLSLQSAFDG